MEVEEKEKTIDIPAYEAFITGTLQPRLEELLGERDKVEHTKKEYHITASKLDELYKLRNKARKKSAILNDDEHDDRDHVKIDDHDELNEFENFGQRVTSLVHVGCGVYAHAVSMKPIKSISISIKDLKGSSSEYSIDDGVKFVTKQIDHLESKLNTLDEQITEVVADIESCLSSVHQLKALSTQDR